MSRPCGDPPLVAIVTASDRPGAAANNESRWIAAACAELGIRCDAVYLAGPRGIEQDRSTRVVRLAAGGARSAVLPLVRYLRRAQPALTVAFPHHIAPFAVLAGALSRHAVVPWEVTLLSRDLGPDSDWPLSQRAVPLLQKLTYRLAPRVAANSSDVAAELLARRVVRDPGRVVVLPNPVEVEGVRAAAAAPERSGGSFRFCAVGRLAAQKGYDVMFDAFARAEARLPAEWELIVLGGGPRRAELEELARSLGLERHIFFLGHRENPYPLMAGADAFVHAARWEGSPVVLKEALALELPVVAAASPGGQREILADGRYGLLVRPEDPDALAEALVRLANDEGLRAELASRGLEGARRYAAEVVARRFAELAAELTPRGRD